MKIQRVRAGSLKIWQIDISMSNSDERSRSEKISPAYKQQRSGYQNILSKTLLKIEYVFCRIFLCDLLVVVAIEKCPMFHPMVVVSVSHSCQAGRRVFVLETA